MFLVGDKVNFPSPHGDVITGKIDLVEEQLDGSVTYVINSDEGIALRNSNSDEDMTFIDDITTEF